MCTEQKLDEIPAKLNVLHVIKPNVAQTQKVITEFEVDFDNNTHHIKKMQIKTEEHTFAINSIEKMIK